MDGKLASARLAALLLYDPARGVLRDPRDGDGLLAELGIDDDALGAARRAWNALEGARRAEGVNLTKCADSPDLDGEVRKLAGAARDPGDLLLALYLSYQVMWSRSVRAECDGALDAAYAAASVAGADDYWYVSFRVSSVQEIVANSRRTSDLWAASYLASLLAWGIARHFVDLYGPPSMVSPFVGANPLYAYYAHGAIRDQGLRSRFDDYVEDLLGLRPASDFPGHALLAAKAELLVPAGGTASEVGRRVEEYYSRAWGDLYSELRRALDGSRGFELLDAGLGELLDAAGRWPPFPLSHVDVVRMPLEKAAEWSRERGDAGSRIWVDYGYGIAGEAHRATGRLYERGDRYAFCTVCGTNVAALQLTEGARKEALCPYCAARRAMRDADAMRGALGRLGIPVPEGSMPPRWPSTATLAAAAQVVGHVEAASLVGKLREFELGAEREGVDVEDKIKKVASGPATRPGTHFYILRGDTDNAGKLFRERRGLVGYVSVSRNFALAALDALRVIERNGGIPIYSGGDDLAALFPAYEEEGVPLPVRALAELIDRCAADRLCVGKSCTRYHMYRGHCRSYSLLSAHAKDPLSVSWRTSGDMVELKDHLKYRLVGGGMEQEKNAVFVLKGSGHVVALPEVVREVVLLPAIREIWSLDGVVPNLLRMVGAGRDLSSGLPHEVAREAGTYGFLREEELMEVSMGILRMLLRRNESKEGSAERAWKELSRIRGLVVELEGSEGRLAAWEAVRGLPHLR